MSFLYTSLSSPIHRLDGRTKFLSLLLLFLLALPFNHPLALFFLLCFVAGIAFLSGCFIQIIKFGGLFLLLFLFSVLLWPVFLRTEGWQISVQYGIAMGLRLSMMIASGLIFLGTIRIEEFTESLEKLGLPFVMSFALTTAFRLVPTFASTTSTIVQAQKSRGLDLESGNFLKRLRRHLPLLVPVLLCAVRQTNLLAMALEAKGFGNKKRVTYFSSKMKSVDYFTLAFLVLLLLFCLFLRLRGYGQILPRI
ncbi:MAG: energy-coupling factor transporter transmembrane component T [Candidatus Edwardsbacteria bacterium]